MLVERGHNGGVVETVALNDYGEGVHGCSHVFGVADLVGGAVHGWQVDIIDLPGCVVGSADLQVRHGDSATSTLKGAVAMVDFGAAWGLLVGLSAKAAAFLEATFLVFLF